ncbi:hypothetical protein Nepgr_028435 [Nepenthes gracilis]|uniref:Uncharacterized protein n=1 Tax=Nepenthes gracilis TaxID=150966 RepID=A0AAD3Y241_NEPGR|nr:hypothetical protein Nepgr_028435 [Nepenthes gracilis]
MVRMLFKFNQGAEWISLVPRCGLRVSTIIYNSLKNWKNQFFFVCVDESRPLARKLGKVPKIYTKTPADEETESLEWLFKLVEDYLGEFQRDQLVSRDEAKKAKWGPPSSEQKMVKPSKRRKAWALVIREPSSEVSPASLVVKGMMTAVAVRPPSSSSLDPRSVLLRHAGPAATGTSSAIGAPTEFTVERAVVPQEETPAEEPKEAPAEPPIVHVVVLSEEPTSRELQEAQGVPTAGDLQSVVDVRADIAEEAVTGEPAQAMERPEEPIVGEPGGGRISWQNYRRSRRWRPLPSLLMRTEKVMGTVVKTLGQQDWEITDRDRVIAWPEEKLEALKAEHWEDAVALGSVFPNLEVENAKLKEENASLREAMVTGLGGGE